MRISDWSSDVCSSDLPERSVELARQRVAHVHVAVGGRPDGKADQRSEHLVVEVGLDLQAQILTRLHPAGGQSVAAPELHLHLGQLGSASCRERVCQYV